MYCIVCIRMHIQSIQSNPKHVLYAFEVPRVEDVAFVGTFEPLGRVTLSYQCAGTADESLTIVRWYRITPDSWTLRMECFDNQSAMTLSNDDIDCCIKAVVTPVSASLEQGLPVELVSDPVKSGPPTVLDWTLEGLMVEGATIDLEISVDYRGSREGHDKVSWFRDDEAVPEARGSLSYDLGLEDVGKHIGFKYTPVNHEALEGRTVYHTDDRMVMPQDPKVTGIRLENCYIGRPVKCVYEYIGGVEGRTEVEWFKSEDGVNFVSVRSMAVRSPANEGYATYRSCADDLHCVLQCQVTPVRHDGRKGTMTSTMALCVMTKKLRAEMHAILKEGIKGWNVEDRTNADQVPGMGGCGGWGPFGAGHLGLTHTETQRGRLWTA